MNPTNFLKQYLTQGFTPQNILNKLNISNPILNNVINMAQNGDAKSVETFARNLCRQKGLDFDTEFTKFKGILK